MQLMEQHRRPQRVERNGAGDCREMTDAKLNFRRAADGIAKTALSALPPLTDSPKNAAQSQRLAKLKLAAKDYTQLFF